MDSFHFCGGVSAGRRGDFSGGNFWHVPFSVCVEQDADCGYRGYPGAGALSHRPYDCQRANLVTAKMLLVLLFFWIASPVSSHVLSRMEYTTDEQVTDHLRILTLEEAEKEIRDEHI